MYIDPNTGGLLFQVLAVVFTLLSGLLFFFSNRIKMGFARLKRVIREKLDKDAGPETAAERAQPQ